MFKSETHPVPALDWYQEIVKDAPETILIIDLNFTIIFHNNAAEGTDPSRYIGHLIFEFFLPEYHELVRGKIEDATRTGEPQTYVLASTYAEPEGRWYMTRVGPIFREGQVVALALFIRNITELKRAEQALSEMNEKLERKVEERTQELNAYARRLEVAEKLNVALRKAKTWKNALEILSGHSVSVLGADMAGVYLLEDDSLRLAVNHQHATSPPAGLNREHDRFLYRLLHSNKARYVQIGEVSEPDCAFCEYIHRQQMRTLMVAPLRTGDQTVGVLYLGWREQHLYSAGGEQLLNTFVESGSNTLQRIHVTEQLELNIQRREHELRILYDIMSVTNEVLDTESLLRKALDITLQAVNCCTGVIHIADPKEQKLKISVRENCPDGLYNFLQLSGLSRDLWETVYQDGKVVEAPRLQTQSYSEMSGPDVTYMAYLGVPIRVRETTLGVLSLFFDHENMLGPSVKQLVGAIADQIGLAFETTHQRQVEKETLILEERQRLARELHDSVSQSLYGLVLSADVSNKLLQLKAYPQLTETLNNIGEVAQQSIKEMRLMLFELRPLSLEAVGLVGALELRLNTVERRANMETSLHVKGGEYVPIHMELDMYRIAVEALNNSLKHAHASSVMVSLVANPDQIELEIADNGKGFDQTKRRTGGIGLSSMKERANRMGGKLTIDTEANSGTKVHLAVPIRTSNAVSMEHP